MPEQPTPVNQLLMKLYLIGLPGSGKSFLGKKLAEALQLPFIDLDAVIEQVAEKSIAEIFAEQGESYFREIEANTLRQQSMSPTFVLSCGGGTPCFHDNMKFINENGTSVFVNTPLSEILLRMTQEETDQRPLFAASEEESVAAKLQILLQKRKPVYKQAHIIVSNSDVSVQEILTKIQQIKS